MLKAIRPTSPFWPKVVSSAVRLPTIPPKKGTVLPKRISTAIPTAINNRKISVISPAIDSHLDENLIEFLSKYTNLVDRNSIIIRSNVLEDLNSFYKNGIQSIINSLGTRDFVRIRIGIMPDHETDDLANFVLKNFNKEELKIMDKIINEAVEAIMTVLEKDVATAMNLYNKKTEKLKD